ncbi:MAG TPA: hypothetical protein VFB10_08490 [Candidatus Dormibacteraeota bacterium]|nr:hypothetical protein [Candidatus Dormibacteraeota bacterium]
MLSGQTTNSVTYTAPLDVPGLVLDAMSLADNTKFGTSLIIVAPRRPSNVQVTLTQVRHEPTVTQSMILTATVTGTMNTAVT